MEDLNEKIERLLSSPDALDRVRSAMEAVTGGGAPLLPGNDPPALPTDSALSNAVPGDLTALLPLVSAFRQDGDDARLLDSLRPFLHGERERRLDEALRWLKLSRLLPLLGKGGMFHE